MAIICVTFLIAFTLEKVKEYKEDSSEKSCEYWKGKYFALADVFDKGVGINLSEEIIEELEKLGVKIKKGE